MGVSTVEPGDLTTEAGSSNIEAFVPVQVKKGGKPRQTSQEAPKSAQRGKLAVIDERVVNFEADGNIS